MTEDIKAEVKEYILNEFLPGESPDSVDDKTPLITGGVLDSIATIKLIAFLEERYGVQIEPHEMNPDYLDFLPDIAALVEARRANG
jgi:acyl carrier protein